MDSKSDFRPHVLVTGACGMVGTATLRVMLDAGWRVTATGRGSKANEQSVADLRGRAGFATSWADITDRDAVTRMVAEVQPDVIVHLAAVIPPDCYRSPGAARAVNVEGTRNIVAAAVAAANPPRLVHASSTGVYGPRNPHRGLGLITPETPVRPTELYGVLKLEAEEIVRGSGLDWVVLRLGGVAPPPPNVGMSYALDVMAFESVLPSDSRVHMVHAADVARAAMSAATRDVVGRTFLVAGDDSHRKLQHEVTDELAGAVGIRGGLSAGLPGDPDDDDAWFALDWLDTTEAQAALEFQTITWQQMLDEVRTNAGWRRPLMAPVAPLARAFMRRRSPFRGEARTYTDPYDGIRRVWGDPSPPVVNDPTA